MGRSISRLGVWSFRELGSGEGMLLDGSEGLSHDAFGDLQPKTSLRLGKSTTIRNGGLSGSYFSYGCAMIDTGGREADGETCLKRTCRVFDTYS